MTLDQFRNWYEELPVLCYGEVTDKEMLLYIKTVLTWKSQGIFISDKIPESECDFTVLEYWLILGLINNDCLDYGSSPRGAWLTSFGNELLNFLNEDKHLEYLNKE